MGLFDSLGNWFKKELDIGQPASAPAPQPSASSHPQSLPGLSVQPLQNQPSFNIAPPPSPNPITVAPPSPTPQAPPVHTNFFNPFFHQLNQAANGAVSDLKDIGDLGALGVANLTNNQQAANNARNAIGNNNANLDTKNFATNLGGLSQDVLVTPAAKAYINTGAGIATGIVNGLTGQNQTSQEAIGGGPLGGITNWASNNGTANEGTARNLASNAINTGINLLTLGKGKAIDQAAEGLIGNYIPQLAESGLGRAAQRLGGSEAVAGLYGAGMGASQAAQSANNIKEVGTDIGKGTLQNLPFGILGVLPNAAHGLVNTANKVADSTPAIINQTRQLVADQGGHIGFNNVADNHPAVIQLNDHLDTLNKLRDNMTQNGLDERNPAMVNNAKAYQATLDELNNTRNAITQGGYVKVRGTPEPTPEAPQVGVINEIKQAFGNRKLTDKQLYGDSMIKSTYKGKPITTNAFMLEFSDVPYKEGFGKVTKAIDKKSAPIMEKVLAGKDNPQTQLTPVSKSDQFVNLTGGNNSVVLKGKYVTHMYQKYGNDITFHSDNPLDPVFVRKNGENVGIIMPVKENAKNNINFKPLQTAQEIPTPAPQVGKNVNQPTSTPVNTSNNPNSFKVAERDGTQQQVDFKTSRSGKQTVERSMVNPEGNYFIESMPLDKATKKFGTSDPETIANLLVDGEFNPQSEQWEAKGRTVNNEQPTTTESNVTERKGYNVYTNKDGSQTYIPKAENNRQTTTPAPQVGKTPQVEPPVTKPEHSIIVSETKPMPDGSKIVIKAGRDPNTGMTIKWEERVDKNTDKAINISKSKTGDDLSNPQNYADTFGVTKQQAEKDFKQMREEDLTPPNNLINNEPPKLTVQQKREIIQENPYQQTKNQVELNPQEGNVKGAIAQATGKAAERDRRLLDAEKLVNKLTPEDKELLYRYDDGEKLSNVLKDAKEPAKLEQAIKANDDAFDYHLSLDRAAGGATLRQNNYTFPKFFQLPEEKMDELGIPENQRFTNGEYRGFHDTSSKYKSYLDAERQAGLKPLYDNPADAIKTYRETGSRSLRNQALFTALSKAAPMDVADLGITHDSEGRRFSQAAGNLPFSVTDDLQNRLKAFRQAYKPETKAGQLALQAGEKVGIASKGMTFLLSPVHYANVGTNFFGATGITGHGFTLVKGFGGGIVSISNKGYGMMLDHYKANGTLDWANNAGLKLSGHGALGRYTDSLGLSLADLARSKGIDSTSQGGVDLAAEYNKVMGHKNYTVEGTSPNTLAIGRNTLLAQNWTPSQLAILKDAGIKWEKNSRGIGLLNPGDTARSAVFGKRLTEATAAIILSAIATGQAPHLKDLINEAGLNPNNPVPNIQTNSKDSKGRKWVIDMPTDPIGLAAGLVTDPKHFLQSRESPILGTATRLITNQNWNGQQIADMSQPGAWPKRIEGSVKGMLPISLQNATNPSLSIKQGLLQDVGFRYKSDPNDPQNVATKQHFDDQKTYEDLIKSGKWSQIPGSNLQDVSPQEGLRIFNDQYSRANVASTKDINGNTIPGDWNALSNEIKAATYLQNDQKTGKQTLSPTFFAAQALSNSQPNRPHSPLFDLQGSGVGFTLDDKGNIIGTKDLPKAQVAIAYSNMPPGDPQRYLVEQANPWMKDYSKAMGDYSNNYQQNMTNYMQNEGWNESAINQYWQKHPSSTSPIAYPQIPQSTTDIMNNYDSITDPTAKAEYFVNNKDALTSAFNAIAKYQNQSRAAKGDLPLQSYPEATPEVAGLLAQLQKNPNHDKSISAANSILIKNNPVLNQYLADIGVYGTTKDLSKYLYQNPSYPGMTQGQLLNNGDNLAQSTLKGISNLASYDIGKNANGQYSFMQNGSLGNGYSSSSGSGSTKHKKIYMKTKRIKIRKAHIRPPHIRPVYAQNKTYKGPLKISRPNKVNEQQLA